MSAAPQSLPDDVDALKAMVLAGAQTIDQQRNHIDALHDRIKELLNHRFGRSSEKLTDLDASQIGLFDESEAEPK